MSERWRVRDGEIVQDDGALVAIEYSLWNHGGVQELVAAANRAERLKEALMGAVGYLQWSTSALGNVREEDLVAARPIMRQAIEKYRTLLAETEARP